MAVDLARSASSSTHAPAPSLPRLDSSSSATPSSSGSSLPTSAALSRQGSASEAGASGGTGPAAGGGAHASGAAHKGGILLNKTTVPPGPTVVPPAAAATATAASSAAAPAGSIGNMRSDGGPSPPSASVSAAATPADGTTCPSKIHFAPLPPAPERRHSISLGVASRSALLHSQGSGGGSKGSGGGNGNGVQWVAMTDDEWEAYKAQYERADRAAGGNGAGMNGEVPDIGTFVLQGGRKMFKKLRSLSSASSVSSASSSAESAAAAAAAHNTGQALPVDSAHASEALVASEKKGGGGLLRFGRPGRNRSVSPAGQLSPTSSSTPGGASTPTATTTATFVDERPSAAGSRRESSAAGQLGAPPSALLSTDELPEGEDDDVVVIVRKSRPPSPAPVKHRSPPPSEASSFTDEDAASFSGHETSSADESGSASEEEDDDDDDDDDDAGVGPSAVGPSRIAFHPPTPPYSGSATPRGGGRSRSASITIAALPSHPGRQADGDGLNAAREDERERAILGFVGGLERVALERKEAAAIAGSRAP